LDGKRQEPAEDRIGSLHVLVRRAELRGHLGGRGFDRLVPVEIEPPAHHRHERMVRERLEHRRAAALEERELTALDPAAGLVAQPRLAAARAADPRPRLQLPGGEPRVRLQQPGELALATDQWGEPTLLGDVELARRSAPVVHGVGGDRLALSAYPERADRLDGEGPAYQPVRRLAEQGAAGGGGGLGTRAEGGRV